VNYFSCCCVHICFLYSFKKISLHIQYCLYLTTNYRGYSSCEYQVSPGAIHQKTSGQTKVDDHGRGEGWGRPWTGRPQTQFFCISESVLVSDTPPLPPRPRSSRLQFFWHFAFRTLTRDTIWMSVNERGSKKSPFAKMSLMEDPLHLIVGYIRTDW